MPVHTVDKRRQRSSPEVLLFVDSGLSFGSANLRKERLGCGWNWHSTRQQSPSCGLTSVYRTPGVIVLTERCTCQREPSERTLGTRVGQDLCIQLPIRTGLGMPSNWTRCCGSVSSNLLHDLDSAEGWAESDRHDREVAADFEAFTLPSRALITSIIRKYRKDHLEDSLDSYYVRKVLRDAPKLVHRTLQLETMATQEIPQTNGAFYLREATRCYIHGFWAACVALSRAAVEQALKEAVAKSVGATASDLKLSTLVESARRLRLADPAVLSLADDVRIAGNRTVHNKASDQPEAWDTLVRVRAVLLALYEGQVPDVPEI